MWEVLVPPVVANKTHRTGSTTNGLHDRPDGHDPRDSHIGHKRIDVPYKVGGWASSVASVDSVVESEWAPSVDSVVESEWAPSVASVVEEVSGLQVQ
jgi:hypothetical protein